jgi:hypothetical protein
MPSVIIKSPRGDWDLRANASSGRYELPKARELTVEFRSAWADCAWSWSGVKFLRDIDGSVPHVPASHRRLGGLDGEGFDVIEPLNCEPSLGSEASSIRTKRVNATQICRTAKSERGTTQPTTIDQHSSVDCKPPNEAYVRVVAALMGLGETS